ncbi:hypothetical protein BH10ACI2_BH10ACI2_05950 [soil metagenome]
MKRNIIFGVLLLSLIYCGTIFSDRVSAQKDVSVAPSTDVVAGPQVSTTIVISHVDGGGGGSTGTYFFDYVELKNVSTTPQSLNGLSLYYGAAVSKFASTAANAFALPNVTLNPGQYYLVQLGGKGSTGVDLPTPDAVTSNLNLSGLSGKVALVTAGFPINTCGDAAVPCDSTHFANFIDWVAYGAAGNGSAGNGEGGTSVNNGAALVATQGAVRKVGGCQDNDNNTNDFDVVTAPTPRNTSSPVAVCVPATPTPTPSPTPVQTPTPPAKVNIFTARLKGSTEVPANASTGTGFGTVVLNDAETQITASLYWNGLGSNTTLAHIHGPAAVGVNASPIFNLNPPTTSNGGSVINLVFNVTPAQVVDLRAGLWYYNVHSVNFPGGEIRGQILKGQQDAPSDFDGDQKTDYALVRQDGLSSGHFGWFILLNGSNTTRLVEFGLNNDFITPGDFDGDGKDDIAIWRQGSANNGNPDNSGFYILRSSDNTFGYFRFGQAGDDVSVVGDYTGDGKDDPAIYRKGDQPAAGNPQNPGTFWFLASSGPNAGKQVAVRWGLGPTSAGTGDDSAYPGDFDGDGVADFCVYRDFGANYLFITAYGTGDGGVKPNVVYTVFGKTKDDFLPGDYDGDGKTDLATARIESNRINWYYLPSSGGVVRAQQWGIAPPAPTLADIPIQGDYDGDGTTDFAVWRSSPTAGCFFYALGSTAGPIRSLPWGKEGDAPVANDAH